jgi:hypothetical protein
MYTWIIKILIETTSSSIGAYFILLLGYYLDTRSKRGSYMKTVFLEGFQPTIANNLLNHQYQII